MLKWFVCIVALFMFSIHIKAFRRVEALFVHDGRVRANRSKSSFLLIKSRFVLIRANLITLGELSFYVSRCLIATDDYIFLFYVA